MNYDKYSLLYKVLNEKATIPADQWQAFAQVLQVEKYRKRELVVEEGDTSGKVGFIMSGILQASYYTSAGKQHIKTFLTEGDFVASYADLLLNQPARVSIQCLEEVLLVSTNFNAFTSFYQRHPCWERIGRLMAEKEYINKERRERLLLQSAEEKITNFDLVFPHLLGRVPKHLIAAYLGITPVTYSRIINKNNGK